MKNRKVFLMAVAIGTVLQVAMVVAGHFSPAVAAAFSVGGMSISLATGAVYARWQDGLLRRALWGGAAAGGLCALLGIAVSVVLGDVPPSLLVLGTLSSTVTGALGAWVAGSLLGRQRAIAS